MRLIDADALIEGYKQMGYDPAEHPEESYMEGWCKGFNAAVDHCTHHVIHAPTIEPPTETKWIPIKAHPATEEEKESDPDIDYWFDCLMPDDYEEILVTVKDSKGRCWVEKDVCYVDGCYGLDSGYDWLTDVVAWKPLPEPYTEDEE